MTTVRQTVFTLERAAAGYCEWHRKTVCEHGTREAGLYLPVGWPDLAEIATEAFASHQAAFGCDCSPTMGTTELPPQPVHHVDIWPSEQWRVVDEPVPVR